MIVGEMCIRDSDRNVKLSEKKMKVAAYCRVSTELEEQDSSYEAQVEYYTCLLYTSRCV